MLKLTSKVLGYFENIGPSFKFSFLFKIKGSAPFILGFYGTDNKFTSQDVTAKTIHIRNELEKRGVKVICSGSDGDVKFLKSQKFLLNFGNFNRFGNMILAGDINSDNLTNQDGLHIAKKLKNTLFDPSDVKRMGNHVASSGHLVIMFKKFGKQEHGLKMSDLDPTDKLNYE